MYFSFSLEDINTLNWMCECFEFIFALFFWYVYRMNGVRLGCSRAGGGCTMRFIMLFRRPLNYQQQQENQAQQNVLAK